MKDDKELVQEENDAKDCDGELTFDDILETVGNDGPFQTTFNWIFNFAYALILSMTFMNVIIAVATPEHWCHVPGRPENYSVHDWQKLTIPLEEDNKGKLAFSKCHMYKNPNETHTNQSEIVKCEHGWEYNKTWYEETISSSEDWVCGKEYYVTHSLVYGRIGELFGTIIFGSLGDIVGRRPVFFVTVIGMIVFRLVMIVTTSNYWFFMAANFFSCFTLNAGFQSPLTIALEISHNKLRALITSLQYLGWTIGMCILPMIMWYLRRWDLFFIWTSVPGLIVILFSYYLIESPRWLLSKGDIKGCCKQMKKIAKINKKPVPDDLFQKLTKISIKSEPSYGMISLFSSWRLFKNTMILSICWSVVVVCYQVILYNIETLGGNPFLNFLLQSLIEFPSNLIGKLSCDRFGRRITQLFGFATSTIASFAMIFLIKYAENEYMSISLTIVVKFFVTFSFYVLNLQSLEIYPTCVRQSGTSFCFVLAIGVSVLGPYISALGKVYDIRYPYVIVVIFFLIGTIAGSFLPETKDINLPETLEEARMFGADQSYWDFCNRRAKKENNKKYMKTATDDIKC